MRHPIHAPVVVLLAASASMHAGPLYTYREYFQLQGYIDPGVASLQFSINPPGVVYSNSFGWSNGVYFESVITPSIVTSVTPLLTGELVSVSGELSFGPTVAGDASVVVRTTEGSRTARILAVTFLPINTSTVNYSGCLTICGLQILSLGSTSSYALPIQLPEFTLANPATTTGDQIYGARVNASLTFSASGKFSFNRTEIPEPGSMPLLSAGIGILIVVRRFWWRKSSQGTLRS